jgi:hypothetical protein
MTQQLIRQTLCAPPTPSRRTWRIRQWSVCPQPILSPWHARSVAVAAVALLHAAVMPAAWGVFLSCGQCVCATAYDSAPPSISERVDTANRRSVNSNTLQKWVYQERGQAMHCPLTNHGPCTFTFRIGDKLQENPDNQFSVDLSLYQSHEGLQRDASRVDWVLNPVSGLTTP